MKNSISGIFRTTSKRNMFIILGVVAVVLIAGLTLAMTRASGFFASVDASKATLSGNATLVTNSDGSKAVEFKAPVTTPPTVPPTPPPTTPPAGGLRGWQLTPTNTGLAAKGLKCDDLPAYTGSSKPAAGTVITQKKITTALNLSNGNITIERSCIKGSSVVNNQGMVVTFDPDRCQDSCPQTTGVVTIRDSEFDGSGMSAQAVAYACAFHGIGILERNYIHDTGSGICFVNTGNQLSASAEGNYVHKLRAYGNGATTGSHNESATIRDFPTNVNPNRRAKFVNNRLDSSSGNDSGALFIQTLYGEIDQVTIEGNLFEGGGYQLVLEVHGSSNDKYGRNMRANDNRFSGTGYGPGYVEDRGLGYGWAEAKNNYINDPTKPGNQGRAVSL
jgi:hypothetical protein